MLALGYSKEREAEIDAQIQAKAAEKARVNVSAVLKDMAKAAETASKEVEKMLSMEQQAQKQLQTGEPSLKLIYAFSKAYDGFYEQQRIWQADNEKLEGIAVSKPGFPALTAEATHPLLKYVKKWLTL
jgi:hypothetical protein